MITRSLATPIGSRRYSSVAPAEGMVGRIEAMALYAGQSAGLIADCPPAARLVREISQQAERILRSGAPTAY